MLPVSASSGSAAVLSFSPAFMALYAVGTAWLVSTINKKLLSEQKTIDKHAQ